MYQIFCDGLLMYDDRLESFRVYAPSLELEIGKTGSFVFTLYTNHPHYDLVRRLRSIVSVWRDGVLLFRGRVLEDEMGFYNEKRITCEGDLSFLLDSIQRPFAYTGTAAGLMSQIVTAHNAQVDADRRFSVGSVADVGVLSFSLEEYTSSYETLLSGLSDANRGYLQTRFVGGAAYLDFVVDFNVLSPQVISFGSNLLDIKRVRRGQDIVTALVPIGKDGLTVESVNGGSDTITDTAAVSQYGYIVKAVEFREITSASELLRLGQAHLAGLVNTVESIELSAADLSAVGEEVGAFRLGSQVQVTSVPHGIDQRFLVSKIGLDLLDPAANKLTLGGVLQPFSSVRPLKGDTGKQGEPGARGEKGEKGDKGDQGAQGLRGLQGERGEQGIQGVRGADGQDTYFHIKYSANASGNPMTETPSTYIGTYVDHLQADSTDYTRYTWARFQGLQGSQGTQGIPGVNGADGRTSYLHIKYSDDGTTFTGNQGEIVGRWIGTYVDFTAADSTTFSRYSWKKYVGEDGAPGEKGEKGDTGARGATGATGAKGDTGATGAPGRDAAVQSDTEPANKDYLWLDTSSTPPLLKRWNGSAWVIVNDTADTVVMLERNAASDIQRSEENILATVSESYTLKDDAAAMVSSVRSDWEQTAGGFEMRFTQFSADLAAVAAGTDAEFDEIRRYIRFDGGRILLGQIGNELELRIANDRIGFYDGGAEVAYFSQNRLYVTDATILTSLQLGEFAFFPRANGNLSFRRGMAATISNLVGRALVGMAEAGG